MDNLSNRDSFFTERKNSVDSDASVHELVGDVEDQSLRRAGEDTLRVQKCRDVKVNEMAYKYCKRCLGKAWAKIEPSQLTVTYVTYVFLFFLLYLIFFICQFRMEDKV